MSRNLMDAAHGAGVGRVISQSIAWAYTAGCEPAAQSAGRLPPGVGRTAVRPHPHPATDRKEQAS